MGACGCRWVDVKWVWMGGVGWMSMGKCGMDLVGWMWGGCWLVCKFEVDVSEVVWVVWASGCGSMGEWMPVGGRVMNVDVVGVCGMDVDG